MDGERLIKISHSAGAPHADRIYRYIDHNYTIRDGQDTWLFGLAGGQSSTAGQTTLEVTKVNHVDFNLDLLDAALLHIAQPAIYPNPLPKELQTVLFSQEWIAAVSSKKNVTPTLQQREAASIVAKFASASIGDTATNKLTLASPTYVSAYVFNDHLGTPMDAADASGALISHQQHAPYGQQLHNWGQPTIVGYAGAESETRTDPAVSLGFIRMGVRYYIANGGRWATPDLYFVEDPKAAVGKPLEMSAYTYSRNNPVTHRDTTGRCVDPASGAICGAVVGGAIGGAVEFAFQSYDRITAAKPYNAKKLLAAGGGGAITGATIGFTKGLSLGVESAAAGAILETIGVGIGSAGGGYVSRKLQGVSSRGKDFILDMAIGLTTFGILRGSSSARMSSLIEKQNYAEKLFSESIFTSPQRVARGVADTSAIEFVEQFKSSAAESWLNDKLSSAPKAEQKRFH